MRSLLNALATLGILGAVQVACGGADPTSEPIPARQTGNNGASQSSTGPGSGTTSGDTQSEPPSAPPAPPPPCPAIALNVGFTDFIGQVVGKIGSAGGPSSNAMKVPTATDRDDFAKQVMAALTFDGTEKCPLPSSYRVLSLKDNGDEVRIVAETDASGKPDARLFWGTFAARKQGKGTRDLIVEAPHPISDTNTESQAPAVWAATRSEWFLLAGAHRCANTATSGCDGATDACGKSAPFRESDAAHSTKTPFWAMHGILTEQTTAPFLQLHGNDATSCPTALVADGSGTYSATGFAGKLAAAIETQGHTVGRCGSGYPTSKCDLCALDNVEGRENAGSADACTAMGANYTRFVHVEQHAALRVGAGVQQVATAVEKVFPAR
jgi:hypothetical protein